MSLANVDTRVTTMIVKITGRSHHSKKFVGAQL